MEGDVDVTDLELVGAWVIVLVASCVSAWALWQVVEAVAR
jgi:hypothetical protein